VLILEVERRCLFPEFMPGFKGRCGVLGPDNAGSKILFFVYFQNAILE
jgi:hypothetical protein